ncbi:hypothetical protein GCM10008905_11380 [Clostridium malenominatum]|uniref:RDD family protein n=1 Tax=Clostridium malenominatum TaxID=1539 RepID=A0ABN1ITS6_9CLOT
MIIYGWGRKTVKNYGEKGTYRCNNCNNTSNWRLVRVSTWFTLFFIPIIPYSRKFALTCPVCGSYIEVPKEEFKSLLNEEGISVERYSRDDSGIPKTEVQVNFLKQMEEYKSEENNSSVQSISYDTISSEYSSTSDKKNSTITASTGARIFAGIIDYLLIFLPWFIIPDDDVLITIAFLFNIVILVIQSTLVCILGQSIGKKLLKIKVVKVNSDTKAGFVTNFLMRGLVNHLLWITIIYPVVDFIFLIRKDKRCIHDFIAGTKVVKEIQ